MSTEEMSGMGTDEQMDARLQAAGARWRASTGDVTTDGSAFVQLTDEPLPVIAPARPVRRRRWTGVGSGIVAAAAVAVGLVWLAGGRGAAPVQTADGDQQAGSSSIAQIHWNLVALVDAHGTRTDPARPATFFLDPDNTQFPLLAGDGCNALSGSARLPESAPGTLHIGDLGTTLMACPGTAGEQDAIHAVLSGTVSYAITGDELTLTRDGVGSLVYHSQVSSPPTTDPSALTGVPWALSGIEQDGPDSGTASGSSEYAQVTLQFDGAGHVTLADGCIASAPAVVGTGSIEFGRFVPDKQVCKEFLGPDEQAQVAKILDGTVTWSISDNTLTVSKAVGALTFERGAESTS
jgi:heat shock protein HslJ